MVRIRVRVWSGRERSSFTPPSENELDRPAFMRRRGETDLEMPAAAPAEPARGTSRTRVLPTRDDSDVRLEEPAVLRRKSDSWTPWR